MFLVRQGRVHFTPVVTGIAGERYFEALSGLNEGDLVVTGPFEIVRNLADGDAVDVDEREVAARRREAPSARLEARAAATP